QRGESGLPQARGSEQSPERSGGRQGAQSLRPTELPRPEVKTRSASLGSRPAFGFAVDAGADRVPHFGGGLDRGLLIKPREDFVLAVDLVAQRGADGATLEMGARLGGAARPEFAVNKIFKLIFALFAVHNSLSSALGGRSHGFSWARRIVTDDPRRSVAPA